jgi:hypothetical protein
MVKIDEFLQVFALRRPLRLTITGRNMHDVFKFTEVVRDEKEG